MDIEKLRKQLDTAYARCTGNGKDYPLFEHTNAEEVIAIVNVFPDLLAELERLTRVEAAYIEMCGKINLNTFNQEIKS